MIFPFLSAFSILALAYFTSRGMLALPWFPASMAGLLWAHVASAGAIIGTTFLVKYFYLGFAPSTLIKVMVAELVWVGVDIARSVRPSPTPLLRR